MKALTAALVILFFILPFSIIKSQTFKRIEYQGTDSIITNPERGFIHQTTVHSNRDYSLLEYDEIKLINEGWSNPVNPRKAELVLRNKITRTEYVLPAYPGTRFFTIRKKEN
jgi:hypothetical protein